MRYFLLILFSFIAVSHAGYWGKDTVFVSSCSASGISIPDLFSNKNNSYEEREKYYRSNAERFKMRALPAVDPKNRAAGLFFQMAW